MKILWINSGFLHPTTRGGQIRTLEMLKKLRNQYEIHYLAYEDPKQPEGVRRSSEYCYRAYPLPHPIPARRTLAFVGQLAANMFSSRPLSVSRYRSDAMSKLIENLFQREHYDHVVCDFLFPAVNIKDLSRCVLFQHNVEAMIWRRYAQNAPDQLRKAYFELQAKRMFRVEREVCRSVKHIISVSNVDARLMRELFGVSHVSQVPTGVDVEYFTPPDDYRKVTDLVFVGSMDWLPNIDGVTNFVKNVLPIIRARRPDCSLAIVGRTPPKSILDLAKHDPNILVTETVPDIRPYLWGSTVAIVPLRNGSGTRLKIYEYMAAKVPVVSTAIGAEGLTVTHTETIRLADTEVEFAAQCLDLLEHRDERARLASAAWEMVRANFSWENVAKTFAQILESAA